MTEFISTWRFSLLLAALVANILLAPLFGNIAARIAFTMLLLSMVLVLGNNRKIIFSYAALAGAALILSWGSLAQDHNTVISVLTYTVSFLVQALVITLIIRNIFASNIVTVNTIASSLCAYLLLGFAFSPVYALIDLTSADSF